MTTPIPATIITTSPPPYTFSKPTDDHRFLQRPIHQRCCRYREHSFSNISRLSSTLACACAITSLSFLACGIEEPSVLVYRVLTSLPFPLRSFLLHASNLPDAFRYTSLAVWFLSSLCLLIFLDGVAALYPSRLLLSSTILFLTLGIVFSSGLLSYGLRGGDSGVTWRELGVLVVPWSVVVGMIVGMVACGVVRSWRRGKQGEEVTRSGKDVEAQIWLSNGVAMEAAPNETL